MPQRVIVIKMDGLVKGKTCLKMLHKMSEIINNRRNKLDNFTIRQEFVFKGDYGYREKYIPLFKNLLLEYNGNSLTGLVFYISNNPYNLEFYISFDFENSIEEIHNLRDRCQKFGLYHMPDITLSHLFQVKNRFDVRVSVIDEMSLMMAYNYFQFPTIQVLNDNGIVWDEPLNDGFSIFISYSHKQQTDIFELISLINRNGTSVWIDEQQIDFGENILKEVTKGINNSKFSIIWITTDFIKSKFPLYELSTLLHESIMNEMHIICVVDYDVDIIKLKELGFQIDTIKHYKRTKEESVVETYNKIKPSIQKFIERKGKIYFEY